MSFRELWLITLKKKIMNRQILWLFLPLMLTFSGIFCMMENANSHRHKWSLNDYLHQSMELDRRVNLLYHLMEDVDKTYQLYLNDLDSLSMLWENLLSGGAVSIPVGDEMPYEYYWNKIDRGDLLRDPPIILQKTDGGDDTGIEVFIVCDSCNEIFNARIVTRKMVNERFTADDKNTVDVYMGPIDVRRAYSSTSSIVFFLRGTGGYTAKVKRMGIMQEDLVKRVIRLKICLGLI